MANLEMTKAEAKEEYGEASCMPSDGNLPRYPYGLTLYLDDETLKKLGVNDLPKVGSVMLAQISVKVIGTSQRATQSSKKGEGEDLHTCVDLQITDMDIAPTAKSAAETLYPAK